QHHCAASILKLLGPNFQVPVLSHAPTLSSHRILIHGDHFLIRENVVNLRTHGPQVIARDKWRGQDRPQTEMRTILYVAHASVAHLEHVRIVPVSRSRE